MGARTTQSFRLRWGSARPGWREKEKERDKDWEDRTRERERKRVRERGGKSPTSLPGVCKHLPRGLLLPQPSLSGFVKALGALIPGCRMRRIEQRARFWHTHARDLFAYPRPLNLFFPLPTSGGKRATGGNKRNGRKSRCKRFHRPIIHLVNLLIACALNVPF